MVSRSADLAEEVERDFVDALGELRHNDSFAIRSLTQVAEENIAFAPAVVRAVQRVVQRSPPSHRLLYLYVMDSIVKNVGGVYLELFSACAANLLVSSLVANRDDVQMVARLQKLVRTWDPVFPPEVVAQIKREIAVHLPPQNDPGLVLVAPGAPVARAWHPRTAHHQPPGFRRDAYDQRYPPSYPFEESAPSYHHSDPYRQPVQRNPPFAPDDLIPVNVPFSQIGITNPAIPPTSLPVASSGLIPLGRPVPPQSQLPLGVPASAPALAPVPGSFPASEPTSPPSLSDPASLKQFRRGLVDRLYPTDSHQCTTCGRRFQAQGELQVHLDQHFKENSEAKSNTTQSRQWFVVSTEWIDGRDVGDSQAKQDDADADGQASEQQHIAPADDVHTTCALCGEKFEAFMKDDKWWYRDATKFEGSLAHPKCLPFDDGSRSEASSPRHQPLSPPLAACALPGNAWHLMNDDADVEIDAGAKAKARPAAEMLSAGADDDEPRKRPRV